MTVAHSPFQSWLDFFICPPRQEPSLASRIYLTLLYLGGIVCWGIFFNWTRWPDTFHDWADITAPRLTFLKNAITSGQLPLHTAQPAMLGDIASTRFLAIPDVILSPQIIFLRFLRVNQFTLFDICFLFTLGFFGLIWLRRTQKLSLLAFTIIYVLFSFNGHLLAHISVGHLTWGGYFLFPWFIVLIFELLQAGKGSWLWVLKASLLLLLIILQGSYHQFIWLLFFMGLLGIFVPRFFGWLLATGVTSVLVSMVRLLPEVSLLGQLENAFVTGYPDILSIINSMIRIDLPQKGPIQGLTANIGTWETTLYVSLFGAVFILYFGMYKTLQDSDREQNFHLLLFPILGILLLSLENIYYPIQKLVPIPIFTGERVPTRIISLALVFTLILAGIQFQKWLNAGRMNRIKLGLVLLAGLAGVHDLAQNFSRWTVLNTAQAFQPKFYEPLQWTVANDFGDNQYIRLIIVGLAITLASLGFILWMVWKEKRFRLLISIL